jgi:hypothetical protein
MISAHRVVACVLAAALLEACTPVRSRIAPPYVIDGRELSAAEMEEYAEEHCPVRPPNKFTTDGCSAWRDAGWRSCCILHDVQYWCGTTRRRDADREFRRCVREASSRANAHLMYAGVRLGGGRFAPFPWRYGYGWPWPHRKSESHPQIVPTRP